MRPKLVLLTCTMAVAIGLAACGGGDDSDGASLAAASQSGDNAAGAGAVQVGQTDLGEVLTDASGLTLYALTDDTGGVSTCNDACADAWPPLTVEGSALPAGLDPNLFSVAPRSDGTFQLSAANHPLYRFAGDSAPGDTNGQGSGGVWFAVSPDGQLIQGDGVAADTDANAGAGASDDVSSDTGSDDGGSDGGYGY